MGLGWFNPGIHPPYLSHWEKLLWISQPVLLPGGWGWRGLVPIGGCEGSWEPGEGHLAWQHSQERTIWRHQGEPSGSESRAKWWRGEVGGGEPLALTFILCRESREALVTQW